MPIEVRVPDLGSFKDVAVIDLLVKPGDAVEVDTPLVTLETEKATMDVPSSTPGVVEALHVASRAPRSTPVTWSSTLRAAAAAGVGRCRVPAAAPAAPRRLPRPPQVESPAVPAASAAAASVRRCTSAQPGGAAAIPQFHPRRSHRSRPDH